MSVTETSATFRQEARELLAQLEAALLELEERPDSIPAIDQVFRAAHTLKGSGAMAGFASVAEMAHELESAFDMVRSGCIVVSPELISLTLWVSDFIRAAIDGKQDEEEVGRQRVHAFVATLRQICSLTGRGKGSVADLPVPAASPQPPPSPTDSPDGPTLYLIRFVPDRDIFRRGIHPGPILDGLGELGTLRLIPRDTAIPPLSELDAEACYCFWDILLITVADTNAIRDLFIFVEDDSLIEISPLAPAGDNPEQLLERAAALLEAQPDIAAGEAAEHLGARSVTKAPLPTPSAAEEPAAPAAQVNQERRPATTAPPVPADEAESFLRVRADRIDALVNLVGELVVLQGRLATAAQRLRDPQLTGINEEAERLTHTMRRQVLQARMVPIGATFARFKRLVRDLSQKLDKEIDLSTSGEKTEIDKTMIDQLQDPLVHLVRNCIDHGIEDTWLRAQTGKPPRGRIHLSARQRGSHVIIEIGDDGAGLDLARIRAKAEGLGIITAEEELSPQQVAELIFHPGLSTAAAVTTVSGRGVGMDVVKETVHGLRGTIEIETEPGVGTTFSVRLPLTLAIVEGLMVQAGKNRYVLPLADVRECIELHRADVVARERQLVMVRGEIVPYLRLREQFGLAGSPPEIEQVVILLVHGERIGLAVDRVIGGHQTVLKGLGRLCGEVPEVSGATILGDGSVALTLDPGKLLAAARAREKRQLHATALGSSRPSATSH